MARTRATSTNGLPVTKWMREAYQEYVSNLFWFKSGLMGNSPNHCIQVKKELKNKGGETIRCFLLAKSSAGPVLNNNRAKGNEDSLTGYSQEVSVDLVRFPIDAGGMIDQQISSIDLPIYAKANIVERAKDYLDSKIFTDLASVTDTTNRIYYTYGSAEGSITTGDTSKVTLDDLLAVKTMAKTGNNGATRKIRPMAIPGLAGTERYAVVLSPGAAAGLKQSDDWKALSYYTGERGNKNALKTGAMVDYDGMLIFEGDNVSTAATGAASASVARNLFLGAQAGFWAIGREMDVVTDEDDYGNENGICTREIYGFERAEFNSVDNGVIKIVSSNS